MHETKRLESWLSSWQRELDSDNMEELVEFQRVVMEEIKRTPPEEAERIAARLEQLRPQGDVVDEELVRVTENCGMDKRSAIKFMQVAADYIRRGVNLPPLLGRWLADALEAATYPERYVPSAENDPEGAAVLMALGLKGGRARAPRIEITGHFLSLLMGGQFRAQAIKKTAEKFDVCEKTVRRCVDGCIGQLDEYHKELQKTEQTAKKESPGKSFHESALKKKHNHLKLIKKYRRSPQDI
ncbi:MAG: hypothetical protein EOL86_13290 [Deltaproteobacteria bacterium]|nr:hypothetical protein [Deltaproteobacteria bacterium]